MFMSNLHDGLGIIACSICGDNEMGAKPYEAGSGKLAQEAGQVAEMVRRGGMGHTRLARRGPQGQGAQAIAVEDRLGRLQHGGAKVTVMIGPARHRAVTISQSFHWQYLD